MKLSAKIISLVSLSTILPVLLGLALGIIHLSPDLMILLIFTTAVAATVAYLITKQIITPLKKLLIGAQNLATGQYSQRIDLRTGDEMENLAQGFNLLSEKLQFSSSKTSQDKDVISAERNKLSVVLSSITDGIIAVDLGRKVILTNTTANNLTGYTAQEMVNQPVEKLIRFFQREDEILPSTYCPIKLSGPIEEGVVYKSSDTLRLIGKNQQESYVQLSGSQITEGIQANLGCILIIHDVTKEHELETMKLDFVSMASHELRTPLTSIVGYLSVFLDENKDKLNEEQRMFLDRVYISAKQVINLVQNLLDVSKIERGLLAIAAVPTDYQAIVTKIAGDLQTQAKQKNITLTLLPFEKLLPQVLADQLLIQEVLNNLVSNAINYTQEGGKVDVWAKVEGAEVITSVKDTGIGIPEEAIPHLFTKFFRVSGKIEQGSKGTGLGLYLSKSIIDRHRGRMWVESELGKGSTFSFSLPLAPTPNLRPNAGSDLILPVN